MASYRTNAAIMEWDVIGKFIAAALIGMSLSSEAIAAGIQAQCGTETGKGFAAEGGLVRADSAGWYDDSVRGETIVRIDTDTGKVDVRFKDATQIWQSVTDQGGAAEFFGAADATGSFMVTVTYPGKTLEALTIANVRGNSGTLIHVVSRTMPQMTNARVMVAECVVTSF